MEVKIKATYVDHMGSDDRVVDAARVSFRKISSEYTEEKNEKLIRYLAKNGHFTPFTHPQITLHEKVPIFVARQRFKHTVGFSYNEVSRRYVDDEPEFFTPDKWRKRAENVKQGSSEEEIFNINYNSDWFWDRNGNLNNIYEDFISISEEFYKALIKNDVAPEQARMILPQSLYTEYYCTGSLAAWARAYKLRSDGHAQKEIQDLAVQWDEIIRPLFPVSWAALTQKEI